jgi:CheY-like chemotaxis protein
MVEFLHNDYFRQAAPGRFTPSQADELVPENNRRGGGGGGGGGMATGSTGSQEGSNTSSPMMSAAPDGVLTMVPGGAASNAVTPGGMIPPPPRSDRERRRRSNSGINVSSSMGGGGGGTAVSRRRRRVEAAECVTIINTQVTMMRSILDDFLDMSKIESGVLHFEKIGFELALLAKQCVQSLASKCKEKGIRIRLRLNQVGLPRKGYADPTRIKQLILNLLTNAIKFTHEGAVELFVEAIPMTHETALAAELPPEAFEWAFGDSVNLDGSSNAINNKNGGNGEQGADGKGGGATNVKGSKSQPLHTQTRTAARASVPGGTPSRGHSKAANTADEAKSASPLVVMVHRADGSAVPMEQKNNASSAAGGNGKGTGGGNTPERKEGDGVAGGSAVGAAGAGASGASHLVPPPPERPSKIILHISVTDSGSGIAPSALPHLFQPYSQEKLSIMRTHGGTGLGLAIVKNIVAHMHGSIHVTTQQGKGSKFSLHLPIDCRKPGSVAGSRAADADQLESDLNEAELQSTVMRLRRLHNDAAEEEEDVIESHLMDKFERSLHAGTGGMPSNGDSSGGINSSGDSDEGGRFARRPPPPLLSGAVNASHGPVVPRAMPMPSAASWLHGSSLRAAAMAAQQHREPSSSSSSLSGSLTGGSRSSGSVPRGPLFHDDVNITLHPLQQGSRTNSGPGTPGGSHIVGPSQAQLQVEGQPNGLGTPGSTNNNPGGAPHAIAASAAAAFPPQSSMAVDLLTASSSQELSSGGLLWPAGSSASAPASAEQRTRQLPPTPVLSLLLVDDADVNLKILCKMLGTSLAINGTKYKLSLTTACNGVDAMRRVEERRRTAHCGFHVILSDIVMPLADGFQFAQMLREFEQKEGARPVPLVALTANALKADVDAYTAASFRWFVPKPFRRADLMGVLTSVLHETVHSPDALAAATPRLSPLSGGDGAGAPATVTAPGTNGSRLSSSGHSVSAAMSSSPAGISVNNAVREPLHEDE